MVQDLLAERRTEVDLVVEIQPLLPPVSHVRTELESLSVRLLSESRIVAISHSVAELSSACLMALADPRLESTRVVGEAEPELSPRGDTRHGITQDVPSSAVHVFPRPGVTDAEGEMAARALAVAGRPEAVCRAGKRFQIDGDVPEANRPAVERVLGNHLIHDFSWVDDGSIAVPGAVRRSLGSSETTASGDVAPHVRTIDLSGRDEAALMATSQAESLALDVSEMTAIQSTFDELGRPPTDVELQSIALAWSEHCSHKTFKAIIEFEQDGRVEVIDGLLAECLVRVTRELNRSWVRSAFVDNAGVIAFDGEYDLAIKVETHNHPSALEPYAGAHTGVGGVIRDILAVSADPIANTDVLCFGPPSLRADSLAPGVTHPARTFREVVRGIADYGNNMGIPTVGGGVWFDAGYTANPLVFCGTVGIAPRGSHPTSPAKGDAIVLIGGRTGRDGIHGATMSSERLDRATAKGSTVQIGAPITEKLLRDVIPHLRDGHMYSAITDCGAGGLCSAVGEMAASLGAEVDLALVPLKYQDLAPWEIWLSEAQERLVLAVPHDRLLSCLRMCTASGVEAAVIGVFREDGQLRLTFGDQGVADLDLGFMQKGCPRRRLKARWTKGHETTATDPPSRASISHEDTLLLLLAHPNIASKEQVIRRYDHEVQGGTFGKPITAGGGPSDAAVLKPREDSWSGAVIAHGVNPLYGIEDPHAMATLAVDEALRNLVAVGGDIDHVALVDNFCWGNVDDPEELGSLVRAAQGCRDAAMLFGTPFISGKDSLRNTSISASDVGNVPRVQSIPGTLLVSALGVVADLRRCVTMDLKSTDSAVFVLGRTDEELGGSHFKLIHGWGDGVPALRDVTPDVMRKLTAAINAGQVLSCHDMSEGGLAVAAAEMVIGGCIGLALDADRLVGGEVSTAGRLFSESSGRLIVEVSAGCADAFEAAFDGLPCARIGKTQPDARLEISSSGEKLVNLGVEALAHAWRTPLLPDTEFHEDAEAQERAESEPISLGAAPDRTASIAVAPVRHTKSIAVMVLTTPGTNCERETASACRMAGANPEIVPMDQLLRGERRLHEADVLILPGGFSYGDHLGAGSMQATLIRHKLLPALTRFVDCGLPIVGICNGFQVLARAGLLGSVSLTVNAGGAFQCRWVRLSRVDSPCPFFDGLDILELPIAHGEGRVVVADEDLAHIDGLVPLRYTSNPNGSVAAIAAVCSPGGNVVGLMPHPERYILAQQHPSRNSPPAGLQFFSNVFAYARGVA